MGRLIKCTMSDAFEPESGAIDPIYVGPGDEGDFLDACTASFKEAAGGGYIPDAEEDLTN